MAQIGKRRFDRIHPSLKKGFSPELLEFVDDKYLGPEAKNKGWGRHFRNLAQVKVNYRIVEAALSCWNNKREEFVFGSHHMCPTLEEIAAIVGIPLYRDISVPRRQRGYGDILERMLGDLGPEVYQKGNQIILYSALYAKSRELRGYPFSITWNRWTKIFRICVFGEVLFGRTSGVLDLPLFALLDDYIEHKSIVPTVLGHLIQCLNEPKFSGPIAILYVWIREHMPVGIDRPLLPFIPVAGDMIPMSFMERPRDRKDPSSGPFLEPSDFPNNDWLAFYYTAPRIEMTAQDLAGKWKELDASEITWVREWGATRRSRSIIVGTEHPKDTFTDMILLPGFDGTVVYQPYRFLRQAGYQQILPPCIDYDFSLRYLHIDSETSADRLYQSWQNITYVSQRPELRTSPTLSPFQYVPETTPEYEEWIQGKTQTGPAAQAMFLISRARYDGMEAKIHQLIQEKELLRIQNEAYRKTLTQSCDLEGASELRLRGEVYQLQQTNRWTANQWKNEKCREKRPRQE